MRNLKLTIEYDGTDFVGWQFQENGRSVQAELERAFRQIFQTDLRVHGAGRTDSGVHARGQVANVQVETEMESGLIQKSVNALLPKDVVVRDIQEVPKEFHARHSAKRRSYEYRIEQTPTAIQRNFCWFNTFPLDEAVLHECAALIIGEHDFSSFCKLGSSADSFECTVQRSVWSHNGSSWVYQISANRFLYGMVRTLVGTMVEIARGNRGRNEFPGILEARDRSKAGMAAPAQGLCLTLVEYER